MLEKMKQYPNLGKKILPSQGEGVILYTCTHEGSGWGHKQRTGIMIFQQLPREIV